MQIYRNRDKGRECSIDKDRDRSRDKIIDRAALKTCGGNIDRNRNRGLYGKRKGNGYLRQRWR